MTTLEITDRIIHDIDHFKTPMNIYLHMLRALDTTDHTIQFHKIQYYGINGKVLDHCRI